MNSLVKLYKTPLVDGHNKLIEDIESFLSNTHASPLLAQSDLCKLIYSNSECQFQKIDIEMTLKLSIKQRDIPLAEANYCSIKNEDSLKTYYFFIKDIKWRSEEVQELTLRMDTLSTFGEQLLDSTYWNDATFVEREHHERFYTDQYREEDMFQYARKVHPISEGIDFPLIQKSKNVINATSRDLLNKKYYLVYASLFSPEDADNVESQNAINCYLLAEKGTSIPIYSSQGESSDIDFNFGNNDLLQSGNVLIFDSDDNPDFYIERYRDTGNPYCSTSFKLANNVGRKCLFILRQTPNNQYALYTCLYNEDGTIAGNGTAIELDKGLNTSSHIRGADKINNQSTYSGNGRFHYSRETIYNSITLHNIRYARKIEQFNDEDRTIIPAILGTWQTYLANKSSLEEYDFTSGAGIVNMKTIDTIDRTDSRIIKIIELPYAPNQIQGGLTSGFNFGDNWDIALTPDDGQFVNSFKLKGNDVNINFSYQLGDLFETMPNRRIVVDEDFNFFTAPLYDNESKLYHSDFTRYKLVYDSFAIDWKAENYASLYHDASLSVIGLFINYAVSSNITSGLLFKLSDSSVFGADVEEYTKDNDFPLTLVAIRNNEVNIYNNAFLNYIRGGYNYDMKAKSLSLQASQLSMQQGLFNSLFGIAKQGTSPQGIATGIIGLGQALLNYNFNQQMLVIEAKQMQNNIDKTLNTNAIQSTNVAGSDNLSLFNIYSENKAYRIVYELRDEDKAKMLRYFHLFGYSTNRNKIPNLDNRCFFNYIKCNAVFDRNIEVIIEVETSLNRISGSSSRIMEDITGRFNAGVFIIHKFDCGQDVNGWNINLDKENWETFLGFLRDL